MTTKKDITNTTAEVQKDLLLGLLTALPGGVEASEARGQQELVRSQARLPTRGCDEQALTALGFVIGPVIANDPIWREATLPPGWNIKATDHYMWSDILDETGKKRGHIFYKAAFYDRDAFMRLTTEP